MQFLVFIFILLSIISSLRKKLKEDRKKEPLFDPWSFSDESPGDKAETATGYMEIEEEKTEATALKFPEKLEIEEVKEQKYVTEDVLYLGVAKESEPLVEIEKAEPVIPSLLLDKEGEKGTVRTLGSIDSREELKNLLLGQQLPLAIVASEILGPPRAFRPIRSRLLK